MENKLVNLTVEADEHSIAIRSKDGGYLFAEVRPLDKNEINITQIDFTSREEGKQLMDVLDDLNFEFYRLPIFIYALPQIGDKITEEELKSFLEEVAFYHLHPDDIDNTLYWSNIHAE